MRWVLPPPAARSQPAARWTHEGLSQCHTRTRVLVLDTLELELVRNIIPDPHHGIGDMCCIKSSRAFAVSGAFANSNDGQQSACDGCSCGWVGCGLAAGPAARASQTNSGANARSHQIMYSITHLWTVDNVILPTATKGLPPPLYSSYYYNITPSVIKVPVYGLFCPKPDCS